MGSYLRPSSLAEALDALAQARDDGRPSVIVAGATDHFPARVGRVTDEDVVDITGLAGLRLIQPIDGGWWIPALATWTDIVEQALPPLFDGLRQAGRSIGGRQIQNRGTVIGNLLNASPAADGMPNLLALDGVVTLASMRGQRHVPLGEFVTGNRATVREPDELALGVFVPTPSADAEVRSTFLKLGSRAYLVISIVMVAAVLVLDDERRITEARIAVGACSPVARRLPALEAALIGSMAGPEIRALVRTEHLADLSPIDDVRGSAAYRLDAAETLVRRALEELVA